MQLIIYRENFFTLKERGRENEGGMDREEGTREESNWFFLHSSSDGASLCKNAFLAYYSKYSKNKGTHELTQK